MERYCFRHEVDFQEYDGSSGTIGNITISSGGLASTDNKMSVNIVSATPVYYTRSINWSSFEPHLMVRLHIDPNTLAMASAEAFIFLEIRSGSNPLLFLSLRDSGTSYQISGGCYNDAISVQSFSNYDITDAEHWVEIYLLRATTVSANNGSCVLKIDGTTKQTISSIDCYDVFNNMSALWVGATAGIDAGTSGVLFLDEISLRDDALYPGRYDVVAGTIYYVSAAGSDAANGTSTGTPWQTLTKVYNEFVNGLFNGDDQILFRAGDTFTASNTAFLNVRNVNASRIDKPLLIGRYGAGANPIIEATAMSGNAAIYGLNRVDFVTIENLTVQNAPFGMTIQEPARGWILRDSVFENFDLSYAMQIYDGDFMQVLSSQFSNTATSGIYIGLFDNPANDTQVTIVNCIIHDIVTDGIDLKGGSVGCIVRGNTIYDAQNTTEISGAGIECRGTRHIVRENHIRDSGSVTNTGAAWITGITVEDNTSIGHRIEFNRVANLLRHASIQSWGIRVQADGGHSIINNSIYDTNDDGILVSDDSGSTPSVVKNNVISTVTDGIQIQNSVLPTSDHNILHSTTNNTRVFGTAKSIATACSQNGIECNSATSNPLFTDLTDLTIDETSPAFETAQASAANIQLFTDLLSKGWHQPNETLPYCITKDGFETQDFSLWNSSTTDGGNLSISTSAAIAAGNYGMQASISSTNVKYVERSNFGTPRNCHVRIYFDPNSITMNSANEIDIVQIRSAGVNLARLIFGYNGTSYYLRFTCAEDGSVVVHSSSRYTITDAVHYIELAYHASALSSYRRGLSFMKIDGDYKEGFFDLSTYLSLADTARVGVCTAPPATVNGTIYFDEVIIDDVGNDMDATPTSQAAGSVAAGGVVGQYLTIPSMPTVMITGR